MSVSGETESFGYLADALGPHYEQPSLPGHNSLPSLPTTVENATQQQHRTDDDKHGRQCHTRQTRRHTTNKEAHDTARGGSHRGQHDNGHMHPGGGGEDPPFFWNMCACNASASRQQRTRRLNQTYGPATTALPASRSNCSPNPSPKRVDASLAGSTTASILRRHNSSEHD